MTAIRVPPLAPLYPDNGADLFATFGVSGSQLASASLVGLNSATMTPVVGFAEQNPQTGFTWPLAAFAASPIAGLLLGRSPALVSINTAQQTTGFAYRFDGRKVRNAIGSTNPTFLNAYFDGRVLATSGTGMFTRQPTTLLAASNDIAFAGSTNTGIATCDTAGNVAGCIGSGTSTATLNLWGPTGAIIWTVTISPPAGQTTITPAQIEFGPSGAIYLLSTFGASITKPIASLRQYNRTTGAMNWEAAWTLGLFTSQSPRLWVARDETLFVSRSGNTPFSGAGTLGPFAESYTSAGVLNWSTPLWVSAGSASGNNAGGKAGGICEVSGNVFAGMPPFGSHTGTGPFTTALANITQLNRLSGAAINWFSIGPVSEQDWPTWLEPRAGRIGTFGVA